MERLKLENDIPVRMGVYNQACCRIKHCLKPSDLNFRKTLKNTIAVIKLAGHKCMNQLCYRGFCYAFTNTPQVLKLKEDTPHTREICSVSFRVGSKITPRLRTEGDSCTVLPNKSILCSITFLRFKGEPNQMSPFLFELRQNLLDDMNSISSSAEVWKRVTTEHCSDGEQ